MRLICISDTHGYHAQRWLELPEGDVLIHAGDFCNAGKEKEVRNFVKWFQLQPFKHKLCIAGNHDRFLELDIEGSRKLFNYPESGVHYLFDESIIIDGIKFYGSPWIPEFYNWSFMLPRKSQLMRDVWNKIPEDTNVLITHGPPHGVLDWSIYSKEHVGCELLAERVQQLNTLKAHIFGHIHHCHNNLEINGVHFVNAAICTEQYKPTNKPVIIDI